ncbi:ROK family transcriptional regulator [Amycolatopsis sp. CA-230715]|uniref:ROK family transcriptional regulator n=1 Tax=Amycolatopsis sp. CA-230715 TaxID=2745196 RepID=UPI001C0251B3|nr:ROK family transcriptional regulator [Amycolatopsis sp. CA-230715]QWF78422.1 N-acetylglucosamine repressor [Amycolatopsis sp. CA-230715]
MFEQSGQPEEPGSAAHILRLVSTGEAMSRSDLARVLGVARSTASLRVQELIDAGLVSETGEGPSRGGRRPRLLRARTDGGFVLAADLGTRHVRVGAMTPARDLVRTAEYELDIAAGPDTVLTELRSIAADFTAHEALAGMRLIGVGIGLPGPVDAGRVSGPSRMPGWHGYSVGTRLADAFGVPVTVDNDANIVALGEYHVRGRDRETLLVVKAGTGIGSGLVSSGVVHLGAHGVAGDVSHVRVSAAGELPCSCGNTGCLETVASGAALLATLRDKGMEVGSTERIAELAANADPAVTSLVRFAGRGLGEVLSTVVNFVNPHAVLLYGRLATIEPYVAAVRGALYERCLPIATQDLEIGVAAAGVDAGVLGAGLLALRNALTV